MTRPPTIHHAGGQKKIANVTGKSGDARIASLTNRYFFAVALQGVMQIVTIIIMARFATGI
jgi:hypothetical protein